MANNHNINNSLLNSLNKYYILKGGTRGRSYGGGHKGAMPPQHLRNFFTNENYFIVNKI